MVVGESRGNTRDSCGEFIGLVYLLLTAFALAYMFGPAVGKGLSSTALLMIGFPLAILTIPIARFTSYELSAMWIGFTGLVLSDMSMCIHTYASNEDFWLLLGMSQALFICTFYLIIQVREARTGKVLHT